MRSITTGTEGARAQIEQDVERFLSSGKSIKQVPIGVGKDAARNMQWKAQAIESARRANISK
jgi:tryptophan synthase alpha subunit